MLMDSATEMEAARCTTYEILVCRASRRRKLSTMVMSPWMFMLAAFLLWPLLSLSYTST
jgi:hypothetical protein